MTKRIASLVSRRPVLVIAAVLALLAAAAFGASRIGLDVSIDALLLPDDPDREFLDAMKARFGPDELIVVALATEGEIFSPDGLAKAKRLTDALRRVPGVAEVRGLASVNLIEGGPDGVRVGPLYREPPSDAAGAAEVRRRALADALVRDTLVAPDGRAAAFVVYLAASTDRDAHAQFAAAAAVESAALAFAGAGSGDRVYVCGGPLFKVANSRAAEADLRYVGPLLLIANALIVALIYRSWRGLLLPVLAILLALAGTIGIMGYSGVPLNPFTNMIPFFLIMLGASYSVYMMTAYFQGVGERGLARGATPEERAQVIDGLVKDMLGPIAVIIGTTFVGYFSLATNAIPAARDIGVFTAIGTLLLFPICALLIPALLRTLDLPARLPPRPDAARGQRVWAALARLARERPKAIVAAWTVATAVAALGASRVQVSTDGPGLLPYDNPVRVSERAVAGRFGGTAVLNVFADLGAEDAAIEPAALARLAALEERARALPEVDRAVSIVDFLAPLKRAFSNEVAAEAEGAALPATREEAAELLLLHTAPDDLARYLDEPRSRAKMVVRLNTWGSDDLGRVAATLERAAADLGFPPAAVRVASTTLMIGHSFDSIAEQMAYSVATSLLFIFPTLVLFTRSLRTGLVALVPNAIPCVFVFGFMGFLGYDLDFTTSTIASITLGITVDDTIHFLSRYRRAREAGAPVEAALEATLREAGPAMIFATGVLAVSLCILNVSTFNPVRNLGQVASFGFAVCLLADLTLHPALLVLFGPRVKPAR